MFALCRLRHCHHAPDHLSAFHLEIAQPVADTPLVQAAEPVAAGLQGGYVKAGRAPAWERGNDGALQGLDGIQIFVEGGAGGRQPERAAVAAEDGR